MAKETFTATATVPCGKCTYMETVTASSTKSYEDAYSLAREQAFNKLASHNCPGKEG